MTVTDFPSTCPICNIPVISYRTWMSHSKVHVLKKELVLVKELAKPNAQFSWESIKIYEPTQKGLETNARLALEEDPRTV